MGKQSTDTTDGWSLAVEQVVAYSKNPRKTDAILRKLPSNLSSTDRRICQFLFYGVIRHKTLIDQCLDSLANRKIRPKLKAILQVALYEIIDSELCRVPKIIHYAVDRTKKLFSKNEASFVNAILRASVGTIEKLSLDINFNNWANWASVRYSHPQWLIEHWLELHGQATTEGILRSNQSTSQVYIRKLKDHPLFESEVFEPTPWADFYKFIGPDWSKTENLLHKGFAYAQDPSTRHASDLIEPFEEGRILDLCSAPGGKAMAIANSEYSPEELVCVDLPGERIAQLKENLSKLEGISWKIIESDVLDIGDDLGQFDVVILDAPCSNTGVLRRRVDAKWRLKETDLVAMPKVQLKLLAKAAEFVRPGGQLIYSTCSIEPAENGQVIEKFLAQAPQGVWELENGRVELPVIEGPDGSGAYRLRRL